MCGILAIFSHLEDSILDECNKSLSKRGPDSYNKVVNEQGTFVFHRLAINDLTEAGNQPMFSGKIMLMCNGEIYNHKELIERHNLKCVSKSDCEVIIRMYEQFGFTETIKRLEGVFAIVLVDGDKIYASRDRLGVRPLYYGMYKGRTSFSSLPNPLLKFCIGVKEFPIGTSVQVINYSDFNTLFKDRIPAYRNRITEPEKAIKLRLTQAVKKRVECHRSIGCLLSGGLDSSLVAMLLVEQLGAENVRTYSIGMEGSTDLRYAKIVANYLKTKHTEVVFTAKEGFDAIPEIIEALGTYDITTIRASVGMYLLCKYISTKTSDRVIFSGEGSDEVFEGYLYFHNAPDADVGEGESVRLIENLHIYDVLRADRCISSNGLELREPFLDQNLVDCALSIKPVDKAPRYGYEKYVLRKAFVGSLPDEIIWRRKEGFSDGVSGVHKSWYQHIQEYVDKIIPNYLYNPSFPSKEAQYYKMIFDNLFQNYSFTTMYWMPKWTDAKDPSGRLVKSGQKQIYDEISK